MDRLEGVPVAERGNQATEAHRSAKIDTTEDLLDAWLTPKNNPVMQGLVSFLNVQPTQAVATLSDSAITSPGDVVLASHNKQIDLMDNVTGDIKTLSPGDIRIENTRRMS